MAHTQDVLAENMALRTLQEKIDRAKDVPTRTRTALKHAVSAAYGAYDEDKDELSLSEPSTKSLKGLLKFLSHPYRGDWISPSIALNPEGHFVAVWDVVPSRYTVEFFDDHSAEWIGTQRGSDGVRQSHGRYDNFDLWPGVPFPIPSRKAA